MGKEGSAFGESFGFLQEVQERLERHGYLFLPVPREHTEGIVTQPLVQRIRRQIKRRGFANVAGHVFLTFSGYAGDTREIFQIPEICAFYRQLDQDLPELPALVGMVPALGYNGPGLYLACLGTVDQITPQWPGYPMPRFQMHIAEGKVLAERAVERIAEAAKRYQLSEQVTHRVLATFLSGITSWEEKPAP